MTKNNKKITTIDLFAGCGGLGDGFEQTGFYKTLAVVEWDKAPLDNYENRLKTKWGYSNSKEISLHFDMQRTQELLNGWNDKIYGSSIGLKALIGSTKLDLVIGGPPCQAYSLAGRVRDENGMKDDYRNFLFESYVKVVKVFRPRAFIFENVPGILSAKPNGTLIIDQIKEEFSKIGYELLPDLRKAIVHMDQYGLPQKRDRIIIVGINRSIYANKTKALLNSFYNEILPKYKVKTPRTVRDAIGDLPEIVPLPEIIKKNGKRYSHTEPFPSIPNHEPRLHSKRDIAIFRLLEEDIQSGANRYVSISALRQLYFDQTGRNSNFHKYHVLRWDEPSTLIPAHLWKDGLRHIHPDPKQARTITVREAARLQGFPDDYIFIGTQSENYKMIGNAVPPYFSKILALAIKELLF